MEKISNYFAEQCVKYNVIKSDNADIVKYGICQFLFFMITLLSIQIIAIFSHRWFYSVVYCIIYMSLSHFTGGYHAKTRLRCYFKTILIFLFYLYCIEMLSINNYNYLLLLGIPIHLLIICVVAPVKHKNKCWSEKQLKSNRIKASLLSIVYFIISFFSFYLLHSVHFSIAINIAIFVVSFLALSGYLFNPK